MNARGAALLWALAIVDLFAEIFNVTDRANFLNPEGDRRLASFLVPNALRGGGFRRQLQLGARIAF